DHIIRGGEFDGAMHVLTKGIIHAKGIVHVDPASNPAIEAPPKTKTKWGHAKGIVHVNPASNPAIEAPPKTKTKWGFAFIHAKGIVHVNPASNPAIEAPPKTKTKWGFATKRRAVAPVKIEKEKEEGSVAAPVKIEKEKVETETKTWKRVKNSFKLASALGTPKRPDVSM
ncbi:hypothetical protein T484DRAFT_1817602, partial [Baffinella frigidus]